MVTNRELLLNKIKRINEKANTDIRLGKSNGTFYLYNYYNGTQFPCPFEFQITYRTSAQMFEYLAGIEDAIDYFTKQKK